MHEKMGRAHAELLALQDRRLERQRGQGTVEYVGLVLLLAVVLAALIGAAEHFKGVDLAGTIMKKLEAAVGGLKASGSK